MSGASKRRPQRRRWIAGADKAEADARAAERKDAERAMSRHRVAKALELPLVLIEWRRSRLGRATVLHSDGTVTLVEPLAALTWGEATFPDLAAAAAAVTPAIQWAVHERVVGYAAVAKIRQNTAKVARG